MTSGSAASILGTAQPVGARLTTFALALVTFVVTVVGSMGAPLLTRVALDYGVSTAAAQWTLTITLLTGCVATPVLGRLAAGPRRRSVLLVTLLLVAVGSAISLSPPFAALLIGRAIQGVGLGLPSLMMAVARDALAIDEACGGEQADPVLLVEVRVVHERELEAEAAFGAQRLAHGLTLEAGDHDRLLDPSALQRPEHTYDQRHTPNYT